MRCLRCRCECCCGTHPSQEGVHPGPAVARRADGAEASTEDAREDTRRGGRDRSISGAVARDTRRSKVNGAIEDDPETQYAARRAWATLDERGGEGKKRFDPHRFKRRVGDHAAAKKALEGSERAPLLETRAEVRGGDGERERERETSKRRGKDKKKRRESNKDVDGMSPAARLRQAQRRCWCILLALLLALILALGALLGGEIDFSYGEWRSRWRSEKRDGRDSTPDAPAASTPQRAETHAKRSPDAYWDDDAKRSPDTYWNDDASGRSSGRVVPVVVPSHDESTTDRSKKTQSPWMKTSSDISREYHDAPFDSENFHMKASRNAGADESRDGSQLSTGPSAATFGDDMDDAGADSDAAVNEEDDEYEIDFNDPSLRTIAPKAWRRRERDLAKIREKARTSAKEDVRKFVSGAHETLGVRGKSEDEYDDALIERVEASPGVVVEKRVRQPATSGKGKPRDDAFGGLAKSQASTLSNSLISDTSDSSKHLKRLSRRVHEDAEDGGGDASGPKTSMEKNQKREDEGNESERDDDLFQLPTEPVVHERQPDSLARPRRALLRS